MHDQVRAQLEMWTPIRILQGVQVVHQRGYHRMRILPGVSPSGMYWRVAITSDDNLIDGDDYPHVINWDAALNYSTGDSPSSPAVKYSLPLHPRRLPISSSELHPERTPIGTDPTYVSWFADLPRRLESSGQLPIAYADYFDVSEGWEIGWGTGIRHPRPPRPADTTSRGPVPMQPPPSTSSTNDAAEEGLLVLRGEPLFPGVTVKFAADGVRGADRATLFIDGAYVHLGVWPAELQAQYTYMYFDPARVDALLELGAADGFTVQPNFQLAHRFAQPLQRWFTTRVLSAEEYLHQWVDDFRDGRAGGRTHEEIADPGFFRWLVDRRYALDSEEESLHKWLGGKAAGIQIHIRPGIQITRTRPYADVFAVDRQDETAAQVRDATDQILAALGQDPGDYGRASSTRSPLIAQPDPVGASRSAASNSPATHQWSAGSHLTPDR